MCARNGIRQRADAAGQLEASLDYLAATDWASLGTQAHGEMLARLQRAQAQLTALNAAVLAAFTAQSTRPCSRLAPARHTCLVSSRHARQPADWRAGAFLATPERSQRPADAM